MSEARCLYPDCAHVETDDDVEVAKRKAIRHQNQTHGDGQVMVACACTKGNERVLVEQSVNQTRETFPNPNAAGKIERTVTEVMLTCTRCDAQYRRAEVNDEPIADEPDDVPLTDPPPGADDPDAVLAGEAPDA